MGGRVLLFAALMALASQHVIQALGLYDTPFPARLDKESDNPLTTFIPLSLQWNMSTRWLGDLRRSYSQILRYELEDTLQVRVVYFTNSVDSGASEYKDEIEQIIAASTNTSSSTCTQENLEPIQQMVSEVEEKLMGCTGHLKALSKEYESILTKLMETVTTWTEESFYTPCFRKGGSLTHFNRAIKCYNSNLQGALDGFYYNIGTTVLATVTKMRAVIKSERSVSYACAQQALGLTTQQVITEGIAMTRRECGDAASRGRQRRGFGKKFKKIFRKAKNGIKKICSKVPCQIGYSIPIGK